MKGRRVCFLGVGPEVDLHGMVEVEQQSLVCLHDGWGKSEGGCTLHTKNKAMATLCTADGRLIRMM